MVAHELATLNDAREENIALKKTCEHLRSRNEGLLKRNIKLSATNNTLTTQTGQYKDAASALGQAIAETYGQAAVVKIKNRAAEILQMQPVDTKPNKKNRPLQVVQ